MVVVSSCREMLGQVPQRAQPLSLVTNIQLRTLMRLPWITRRKVGMTSNHHAPYVLGYTRATMAGNKVTQNGDVEQITKTQSQFGL